MKKLLLLFISISLCLGAYIFITKTQESKETGINTNDKAIAELQQKISEFQAQEQAEKIRRLQLEALQNPDIIMKELNKIGKLIVYQGQATYEDVIKEKTFWGTTELALNLKYNFGVGIDLSKIHIANISGTTVVLRIPKDQILLEYVELASDKSDIDSTTTWLAKNFTPEDIEYILEGAWKVTKSKLEKTADIYNIAEDSLKENIEGMVLKLGYTDVIFESN